MCIVSLVHASAYHFRSIEREHWEISYWCWSLKLSWMLRIIATAELGSSSGFTITSTTSSSSSKKCAGVILVGRNLFCHHFALIKHLDSPRIQIQNYYYLVETIFSPYLARACHWRWSGYTHNLVVVCFHIPAGVIFIRRHISTFSCRYYRYYRYYRYLHHCCVSCKHTKCTVHSVELYCPYL